METIVDNYAPFVNSCQVFKDCLSFKIFITAIYHTQYVTTALNVQSTEDIGVQADYLAVAPGKHACKHLHNYSQSYLTLMSHWLGSLRGMEVCGETVLEVVGDKSQKLEWPGYGFYMEVPDGALPLGVTAISVAVKAILSGHYQLPENSQLISAIYWISASEVFLKEVAVNIQHCAIIRSEEECLKFRFIIAKCSQEKLPYKFKEKEGVFNPHTQYATIKLKQFLMVGEVGPQGTEIRYTALKFYKQIPSTVNVEFKFVVVCNHEPILKVLTHVTLAIYQL